jgi:hypothetical protein
MMSESDLPPFIELSDFWLSVTRRDFDARGPGLWKLHTRQPQWVFQQLRMVLISGELAEVASIKVPHQPMGQVDKVYVNTAPYTDLEMVTRLAEELLVLHQRYDFQLTRPLHLITELHNTWLELYSRPGDSYHALLKYQNWIYKYQDGELEINAPIQALHQALEDPPEKADPELLRVRSLLPRELFAGK